MLQTPDDTDLTYYFDTQVNLTTFSLTPTSEVEATTYRLNAAVMKDALHLTMSTALKYIKNTGESATCAVKLDESRCEHFLNNSIFHNVKNVSVPS